MSLGNPLEFSKTFQLQRLVPKSDRGRRGRWDSFPRVLVVSLQCGSHLVTAYLWKMGRRPGACLAGLGPDWQTGSSRRKPSLRATFHPGALPGGTDWDHPGILSHWPDETGRERLASLTYLLWRPHDNRGTVDQSALFFGWVMAVCLSSSF